MVTIYRGLLPPIAAESWVEARRIQSEAVTKAKATYRAIADTPKREGCYIISRGLDAPAIVVTDLGAAYEAQSSFIKQQQRVLHEIDMRIANGTHLIAPLGVCAIRAAHFTRSGDGHCTEVSAVVDANPAGVTK
jgi:hypothetical protein